MAREYPLYDKLVEVVDSRAQNSVDINRLSLTINNISINNTREEALEHYSEIAALIYHHGLIEGRASPYDSKVMIGGKGVLHHTKTLPHKLQQIIGQYIETPNLLDE